MSKKTGGSFLHGRKSNIGQAAVQLTSKSGSARQGVLVKAAAGNTGLIYVGSSSDVTADSEDETDGFELSASEFKTVEVDDPSKVFVIASESNQKVFWSAV
ncbi:MAG: hypothetical protein IH899_02340 [Planctomycetes bacterium]|nr:hypothetical protein [Planctomycetota bacterium]